MSQDVTIMAGLDIGTTKICCVIAKQGAQGIEIIGMGQVPSPGVKLGQILNVEATAASIRKAVDQAQLMAGTQVSHVVVGIIARDDILVLAICHQQLLKQITTN
jgi:cell division protein FtsA